MMINSFTARNKETLWDFADALCEYGWWYRLCILSR